jgi:hypothetical protein
MARTKPLRTDKLHLPHQGGNADAPPSLDGKKPATSVRVWSPADDVRILEGLVAHVAEHGKPPVRSELHDALKECTLDKVEYTVTEIYEKVRRLKTWFFNKRAAGGVGDDAEEARKYELSTKIWSDEKAPRPAEPKRAKNEGVARRGLEEMRSLYPYLAATVDEIASGNYIMGPVYKRAFELVNDEKAAKLEAKARKQRIQAAKTAIGGATLRNQMLNKLIKFSY